MIGLIRRTLCALLLTFTFATAAISAAHAKQVQVTDILGRTVTVPVPAKRIAITEARHLVSFSVVDKDIANRIVGYAGLRLFDKDPRILYQKTFPAFAQAVALDDENWGVSIEKTVALAPDLVLASVTGPISPKVEKLIDALTEFGIPIVFVDFRMNPFEHTLPSIEILGKALGKEDVAAAFTEFYRSRRDRIEKRLAEANPPRPKVLIELQASIGNGCCMTAATANLGRFVTAAGGDNIALGKLPSAFGRLNPEYVLAADPEVYIGTGGRHMTGRGGIIAGPGVEKDIARASLLQDTSRPVIAQLSAVRNGRAYGLWHNFHNSPLNIIALELFAKWFHPDLFADVDPAASVAELNRRFLPIPFQDNYWIGLSDE